jgi:hypothetical protein
MSRRQILRRAAVSAAVLALAAPAAAQARDMYGLDGANNLHRFDHQFPGRLLDTVQVQVPAGVTLRGIDFRSSNGDLIGVGNNNTVYRIDPGTGAAAPIGGGFVPGITGDSFGVDVNPAADALRITSNANDNFRISFATGTHGAGSPDAALNPGDPTVVGSAYTNASLTATRPGGTTLYAVDSGTDQLLTQLPPNAGTLVDPKPLGVDIGLDTGFDIAGAGNEGFLVAVPAGQTGSVLHTLDIRTGAATAVGPVATGRLVRGEGAGSVVLTGLAARQNSVAPAANIAPNVQIVRTTLNPRPNQNAAYIARANDPDGTVTAVEWDTDGDGGFDDATGFSARARLKAGVSQLNVRVTDDAGARTVASISVLIGGRAAR